LITRLLKLIQILALPVGFPDQRDVSYPDYSYYIIGKIAAVFWPLRVVLCYRNASASFIDYNK